MENIAVDLGGRGWTTRGRVKRKVTCRKKEQYMLLLLFLQDNTNKIRLFSCYWKTEKLSITLQRTLKLSHTYHLSHSAWVVIYLPLQVRVAHKICKSYTNAQELCSTLTELVFENNKSASTNVIIKSRAEVHTRTTRSHHSHLEQHLGTQAVGTF